jgi:hypothetical protein
MRPFFFRWSYRTITKNAEALTLAVMCQQLSSVAESEDSSWRSIENVSVIWKLFSGISANVLSSSVDHGRKFIGNDIIGQPESQSMQPILTTSRNVSLFIARPTNILMLLVKLLRIRAKLTRGRQSNPRITEFCLCNN